MKVLFQMQFIVARVMPRKTLDVRVKDLLRTVLKVSVVTFEYGVRQMTEVCEWDPARVLR